MLGRKLSQASSWRSPSVCLLCAARGQLLLPQCRSFSATGALLKRSKAARRRVPEKAKKLHATDSDAEKDVVRRVVQKKKIPSLPDASKQSAAEQGDEEHGDQEQGDQEQGGEETEVGLSLKEAMLGKTRSKKARMSNLPIEILSPEDLNFEAVDIDKPPVPMLSYGLDRVLFNPGVYRLQDPRSRVYNFDPYLEKIMPVNEFDFDALSEYKTSSKDKDLLAMTRRLGAKFTGSTSSMSGILQHFHYALSGFRKLDHGMMSRAYPEPSGKFSRITTGPSAVFLRYKDGIYALDADKSYDTPNIMSWLGHSLEKLLTTDRGEFERFRRSSPEKAPTEDNSGRCFHYSKQGNFLMRSQLDAHDPRLPGTGVFDLKTRAVVSIRMNHKEYEEGLGYQLRYAQGQWESFEREFYDMTRATLLKYSLQVRMGRMDGIFLAYHNIERIFGFQYLSLADMDKVLHGQEDTCLGDQEFKLSIRLLDELIEKAIKQFPETSIRLHFEARDTKTPFMYIFAEPVTEEQADEIQNSGEAAQKKFARNVVGVGKDNPEVQEAWQNIQDQVDEQVDEDEKGLPVNVVDGVETHVKATEEVKPAPAEGAENEVEETAESEVEETAKNEVEETAKSEVEESTENDVEETAESEVEESTENEVEETTEGEVEEKAESEVEETAENEVEESTENEVEESTENEVEESTENEVEETTEVEPEVTTETSETQETTEAVEAAETAESVETTPTAEVEEKGPLIGWTLTVRSKVNGGYVERPVNLTSEDNWTIEYHIQEIGPGTRWKLYEAVKKRRHQLIGMHDKEADKSLTHYRNLINEYSMRGRKWRETQDRIDEEKGVHVFRPLGPGSDAAVAAAATDAGVAEVGATVAEEAPTSEMLTGQEETASASKES